MKQLAKSLVVISALAAAGSAGADMMGDFNPYVGADYYQAWMRGKSSYNQIFPKSYPGATIYIGNKFTENFGLELGYDWSAKAKKSWTLPVGTQVFNSTVATSAITGTTKIQRTGFHLDLVGFLPINDCVNLLGSIGYGWVQPKIEITSLTPSANGGNNNYTAISSLSGKGRSVFRVAVGADWMATDMFGLRAKLGWESTSTLRINGNQQFTNLGYQQKGFKGSTTLAIGAFVKF